MPTKRSTFLRDLQRLARGPMNRPGSGLSFAPSCPEPPLRNRPTFSRPGFPRFLAAVNTRRAPLQHATQARHGARRTRDCSTLARHRLNAVNLHHARRPRLLTKSPFSRDDREFGSSSG